MDRLTEERLKYEAEIARLTQECARHELRYKMLEDKWKKENLELAQEVAELRERLKVSHEGLKAVQGLIDETNGVTGLHLNGDDAPWEELLEGGRYEEWLLPFSVAIKKASKEGE